MKKFVYLISPAKINEKVFYKSLENVLKIKRVKFFQIRLKNLKDKKLINIGKKIKKITKKNRVKLIINDRPFIAKKINADGCHIGQKDLSLKRSRKILGKNKIIGVTCHNSKALALKAKKEGADYIAFGSFFRSQTKKTLHKTNITTLRWAKKKINMPIVAIGGIDNFNYKKILRNGANFIACSSYIWNNKKLDPISAIKKLKM